MSIQNCMIIVLVVILRGTNQLDSFSTGISRRSPHVSSTSVFGGLQELREGDWLAEATLWTQWSHCGMSGDPEGGASCGARAGHETLV